MITTKPAQTDHTILPIIANRWSTLAFSSQPIEKDKMMSLLEAARWAASSYNEQPWRYIVGYKGDGTFEKLASCLNEGNSWAENAGVLLLSVAKKNFSFNGKPNRHNLYDTGAADFAIMLQATDLDLTTHQMAGFDQDKAREIFHIDDEFDLGAVMAIGYPGDPNMLEGQLKERENAPRSRKKIDELLWPTA